MRYAENTSVPVGKSQMELISILNRYRVQDHLIGQEDGTAFFAFRAANRQVKIFLPLPDRNAQEFQFTPERGYRRDETAVQKAWEQACRQRWRALTLYVKALLEAQQCGIVTFDEAFLAHIVLPDNRTAGQFLIPQIAQSYETHTMPMLMLEGK